MPRRSGAKANGDDKMLYEKSCGAVVFRDEAGRDGENKRYVLMIKQSKASRFSFPKGHVECGESETDTAEREVLEETSVAIRITESFRKTVSYSPRPGVKKQVVYFVAQTNIEDIKPQEGEITEVRWVEVSEAASMLGHANDRRVFSMALDYLQKK